MKKIAYITLTIILILSFAVPIAANNLTNMRNDRNALSNRSTQQRRELNSIQNQMNALEFQMRMLDLDIEIAEQSYQHYTEWLEWAQRELDALEEELSRALIDYEEHMQRFADRIRHLNMTNTFGRNNLLLLLNSGNLNE
ncbi:MAG: hypothetical protein FWC95_00870, partial [Defluviitaleaceae bacterium]|nr:hypothetical protein [Defluviitaleaceae bacterium]